VRWHTECPAHFGFRFLCPLFRLRIMSVRTGRLGNLSIEQRPPTPTGELHHRMLRVTASSPKHHRFALLGQDGPHNICRDLNATRRREDGRPTGAEGRATVLGGGIVVFSFFFTFVSLVRLILWLPRRRVWGARALPPSPLWGASRTGRDGRQETG